jgi:hypothetical protein
MSYYSLPQRFGGENRFDNGPCAVLPSTLTREIEITCFVEKVEIVNVNTLEQGAVVVSVYDGNHIPLITPTTLGPGEVLTYTAVGGRRMTDGVWWTADTTGAIGYIMGFIP